jgi:hypothetical protein
MEFDGDYSHLPFRMLMKGKEDIVITKDRAFVVGL